MYGYGTGTSSNANLAQTIKCKTIVGSLMLKFARGKLLYSARNIYFYNLCCTKILKVLAWFSVIGTAASFLHLHSLLHWIALFIMSSHTYCTFLILKKITQKQFLSPKFFSLILPKKHSLITQNWFWPFFGVLYGFLGVPVLYILGF